MRHSWLTQFGAFSLNQPVDDVPVDRDLSNICLIICNPCLTFATFLLVIAPCPVCTLEGRTPRRGWCAKTRQRYLEDVGRRDGEDSRPGEARNPRKSAPPLRADGSQPLGRAEQQRKDFGNHRGEDANLSNTRTCVKVRP